MADITILPGMRRRLLRFDPVSLALDIAPKLDAGDRAAATKIWLDWRQRALAVLNRKAISPDVRAALIRQASDEVRQAIVKLRGSAALGPVPADQRPANARPSASVIAFPRRAGGAA